MKFKNVLIIAGLSVFFFVNSSRAGGEDDVQPAAQDFAISALSDHQITPFELSELRGDVRDHEESAHAELRISITQKEIRECAVESDPFSCLKARMTPYVRGVISPFASVVASFTATTMLYPLDTLKIREQYKSAVSGNYYRGFASYSTALALSTGIHYPLYDALKSTSFSPVESAMVSSTVSTVISSPAWVYRTRKSLAGQGASGMDSGDSYSIHCFLKELRVSPKLGFSGLGAGVVCLVPQVLQLYLYEHFLDRFEQYSEDSEGTILTSRRKAISSAASKILVSTIAFPVETVRLIRQKTDLPYETITQNLWKEGFRRFYRGFSFGASKQALWIAGYMEFYSWLKEELGYENSSSVSSKRLE